MKKSDSLSWWKMKVSCFSLVALHVVLFCATEISATPITIDLGAFGPKASIPFTPFSDLNGMLIAGQTLSIDFVFAGTQNLRVFPSSNPGGSYGIQFFFTTTGSSVPGLFVTGTAYLTDIFGNPVTSPRAVGDIGGAGAYLDSHQLTGLPSVYDFHGVHFDIVLPNEPGRTVTSGTFFIGTSGGQQFLLTSGVPEGGSTVAFLVLAILAISLARRVVSA